jgi:hypothetical protein
LKRLFRKILIRRLYKKTLSIQKIELFNINKIIKPFSSISIHDNIDLSKKDNIIKLLIIFKLPN